MDHTPAALEAAHIQWHHRGGPGIDRSGQSQRASHHWLFDPGMSTVAPAEHRVVFSPRAIAAGCGQTGQHRHQAALAGAAADGCASAAGVAHTVAHPGPGLGYWRWRAPAPGVCPMSRSAQSRD